MYRTGLVIIVVGFFIMFFSFFIIGKGPIWLLPLVIGALVVGFGWMVLFSKEGHGTKGKTEKAKKRSNAK